MTCERPSESIASAPHGTLPQPKNAMDIAIPLIPGWHVTLLWSAWVTGAIAMLLVLAAVFVDRVWAREKTDRGNRI